MLTTQVIPPSPPLRPYVSHYLTMKSWGSNMDMNMNILPMGCMKWMFHRSLPFIINGVMDASNVASVCGQYTEAVHVSMLADIDLIFVFFQPYAMSVLTGMPCSMFESSNVSMGFTDHSHLNKEFKQFAGMSPTEYIEHIKEIKKANMFRGYKQYHE